MPRSTRRPGAKLLLCLALAATALFATPAAAQPLDHFDNRLFFFSDVDGSGGASCGDHLLSRVIVSSAVGSFDLTNLTVRWEVPPNTRIVAGHTTLGFGPESDCTLVNGTLASDREVVAHCTFLCRTGGDGTGGTCTQVGLDLQARLEILDPNLDDRVVVTATADADQVDPSTTQAVFAYDPCPPANPPVLEAILIDTLHHDVNGNGQASPGDTLRYLVHITSTGGSTAVAPVFRIPPPEHARLVVGSVFPPPGSTVVSGNAPGDVTVEVELPDLAPGAEVGLTFDVLIDSPLPPAVDHLVTQGVLDAVGVATLTDDPATPALLDPTVTPLDPAPDLAVDKVADPPSAEAGGIGRFTIGFANVGRTTALGVVLREIVPAHTRFSAADSSPGWSCPDGAGPGTVCELVVGSVVPGSPGLRNFAVRVDDRLAADVHATTNTVSIADDGAGGPDPDPSTNVSTADLALVATPELALAKSGPAAARPGDVVAYTLTAANQGGRDAPGAQLMDSVPLHARFDRGRSTPGWSCADGAAPGTTCTLDLGTLAALDSETAAFAVRIDAALPHGAETLTNTALLRDGAGSPPSEARATTRLDAAPVLALDKTGPASAAPGEVVAFSLGYANTGDQDAAGVTLTETLPAPARFAAGASSPGWSCADGAPTGTACTLTLGALAAGEAGTATFAVTLPPTLAAAVETLTNTASLADDDGTPPATDDASVALDAAPRLVLAKTGPDSALPGQTIVFELRYGNDGDQDAATAGLEETVPAHTTFSAAGSSPGWTCPDGAAAGIGCTLDLGPLAAGASGTATFAVRLAATVPADLATVRNTAVLTGGPTDPPGDDDVDIPVDAEADLRLVKSGPSTARPGDLIPFTLAYRNAGDRDTAAATLADTVPQHTAFSAPDSSPGWSCPDGAAAGTSCTLDLGPLAAGASGSVTFAVRLAATVPASLTAVRNTAVLTGGPADPPGDDDVEIPVDATATLVLDKRGPATATAGDTLVYTLDHANRGDTTAPGAVLTDTVPIQTTFLPAASSPGWSCTAGALPGTLCTLALGDLAPGAAGSVTFAVRVDPDAAAPAELVNTATLSDAAGHPPATDSVTTALAETPPPEPPAGARLDAILIDTFLADADADGRLGPGDVVGYTAVVTNPTATPVHGVRFTLAPDPHTALVPGTVTTTAGTIESGNTEGDSQIAVTLDDLAPASDAVITFEVRLLDPLPPDLGEIAAQGDVAAADAPATVTDDPDTAAPLDPTRTPLGDDAGPPEIVDVPTLHGLGLAALAALLGALALRRLTPARRAAR